MLGSTRKSKSLMHFVSEFSSQAFHILLHLPKSNSSKLMNMVDYRQKREAEALQETAKAYKAMVDTLGGPQGFLQYKMIETGTYERLAKANALAVSGMQPKITTWNSGSAAGEADSTASIRNIMQSLPPLLSTIHDQTGIAPPSWIAQMPQLPSPANGTVAAPKPVNGKLDTYN